MRTIFLLFMLLVAPIMAATYKIVASSHYTQQDAIETYHNLRKELHKSSYYTKYQQRKHYDIFTYPQDGYFLVTIEPIKSTKILSKLFKIVKRTHSAAFVSYASKTPLQNITTQEISSKQPIEHPSEARYRKHKKPAHHQEEPLEKDDSASSFYLYGIIALLTLIIIILYLRLRSLQKALSKPTDSSTTLSVPTVDAPSKPYHLHVDIHSHLIPGIDDGVNTLDESIALLKKFQTLGYKKIITTPHIMAHRYANNSQILRSGFERLQEKIYQEQLNIQVELASEYYLDDHLMHLIADFDILTFGKNYLLFEMSYINHPVNLESMIEVMIEAGYTPVLAHPERYVYLSKNFAKYHTLKKLGVLFQLNINSIAGYYSEEVKRLALQLIDEGMIDFIGSDVHHMRHMKSMEKTLSSRLYRDIFLKNTIRNNTL